MWLPAKFFIKNLATTFLKKYLLLTLNEVLICLVIDNKIAARIKCEYNLIIS